MKQLRVILDYFLPVVASARHRHQEEARLRLHRLESLDNSGIISTKCFGIFTKIIAVNVRNRPELLLLTEKVVDAERDYVCLTELVGVPEIVVFGERLPILLRGHAAFRKIVNFAARRARDVLPPRVLEVVVVALFRFFGVGRFEFARRKRVADAADRAENRGETAVIDDAIERLFRRIVKIIVQKH